MELQICTIFNPDLFWRDQVSCQFSLHLNTNTNCRPGGHPARDRGGGQARQEAEDPERERAGRPQDRVCPHVHQSSHHTVRLLP